MDYQFTEVFDIPTLTRICEAFTRFSGVVTALLDLKGNVHIATGWQDICTKFHRVHSVTACRCTESDTMLAGQLEKGKSYNVYRCKNGLVDVAIPVIVKGEHVGNFFTGQFFFEAPNICFFINQAQQFGFDKQVYLDALGRVPVFSEEEIKKTTDFLVELTQLIGEMGVERLSILESEKQTRHELEELVAQRTTELNKANVALETANKELSDLARIDELTKIPNRRAFDEYMATEWRRLVRSGNQLSVLLIDVDHFKLYNDHYGHQYGDRCLTTVANQMKKCLHRPSDFLARYGGEEFICVLPETTLNDAVLVAKLFQEALIESALPHEASPIDSLVTLSIGAAGCRPKDCKSSDDLISAADECLYQVKNSGRNQVLSQII